MDDAAIAATDNRKHATFKQFGDGVARGPVGFPDLPANARLRGEDASAGIVGPVGQRQRYKLLVARQV